MAIDEIGNALGLVADNAKSVLHHDGVGFGGIMLFECAEAESFEVSISINGAEATDDDGVDGRNTSVRLSDDFAAAINVVNCFEGGGHAKTSLETEEPIVRVGIREGGKLFAHLEVKLN